MAASGEAPEAAERQTEGKRTRAHNKTLSVATMCVNNEDRSPALKHRNDPAPTPTGFAEFVCDDFPRFHLNFSCIVGGHGRRLRTIANTTAAIKLAAPTKSNTKEVGFFVAAAQLFNSIQARAVIGGVFAGLGRYRS